MRTGDTVWVLGDLTLGPIRKALHWVSERPGIKRLILGNHDELHPAHQGAVKKQLMQQYLEVFDYVSTFARIKVTGRDVLLSHFPYPGTSEGTDANGRPFDDRYSQWRLPNEDKPLIHGHTHRAERLSWNRTPDRKRQTPQIHVGLDAWGLAPVGLHEIEDILTDALARGPR